LLRVLLLAPAGGHLLLTLSQMGKTDSSSRQGRRIIGWSRRNYEHESDQVPCRRNGKERLI
jgi:hypothetical protein